MQLTLSRAMSREGQGDPNTVAATPQEGVTRACDLHLLACQRQPRQSQQNQPARYAESVSNPQPCRHMWLQSLMSWTRQPALLFHWVK